MKNRLKLDSAWFNLLEEEINKSYFKELYTFLDDVKRDEKTILPAEELWFNALNSTPLEQVKVVILGQDPYPTKGHAHGLCFSALPTVSPLPKSLFNIYKELKDDLNIDNFHTPYLQPWAEQGVLLLNAVLTVEEGVANAHANRGWEAFTTKIIELINDHNSQVVFILWGAYAQKKASMIDQTKHLVLKSAHPSPLSAYRGFWGSKPFSKTDAYLEASGKTMINWKLS